MYQIQPRTKVRVKQVGTDWIGANIQPHYTINLNMFTDKDLIIDPETCFNPVQDSRQARIKARWAECGYYGFVRNGWIMLVKQVRRE